MVTSTSICLLATASFSCIIVAFSTSKQESYSSTPSTNLLEERGLPRPVLKHRHVVRLQGFGEPRVSMHEVLRHEQSAPTARPLTTMRLDNEQRSHRFGQGARERRVG